MPVAPTMFRVRRLTVLLLLVPLYAACSVGFIGQSGQVGGRDWRMASREPVGLAPDPLTTPEAVVQVYSARALRWRGYFGVHTWIAVKPKGVDHFTIHEVMGYGLQRTGTSVRSRVRAPDAMWYGNRPELLSDVRGTGVDALIARIEAAVHNIRTQRPTASGPGPTRIRSRHSCCVQSRSCEPTCRRLRSARTILV